MSASGDKLRMKYPEFEDLTEYPDSLVDFFISEASNELEPDVWGVFFEPGSLALAAHMLAIRGRSQTAADEGAATAGAITAVKTKDLNIAFGSVGSAIADGGEKSLLQTPYGLEFIRLREKVVSTPLSIC